MYLVCCGLGLLSLYGRTLGWTGLDLVTWLCRALQCQADALLDVVALGLLRHDDLDLVERAHLVHHNLLRFVQVVRRLWVVRALDAPAVRRARDAVLVALAVLLEALGLLAAAPAQHDRAGFLKMQQKKPNIYKLCRCLCVEHDCNNSKQYN